MSNADALRHEVFTLAYHLHWSPDAVLEQPVGERRAYLRLLREQLEREEAAMKEAHGRG